MLKGRKIYFYTGVKSSKDQSKIIQNELEVTTRYNYKCSSIRRVIGNFAGK